MGVTSVRIASDVSAGRSLRKCISPCTRRTGDAPDERCRSDACLPIISWRSSSIAWPSFRGGAGLTAAMAGTLAKAPSDFSGARVSGASAAAAFGTRRSDKVRMPASVCAVSSTRSPFRSTVALFFSFAIAATSLGSSTSAASASKLACCSGSRPISMRRPPRIK